MYIYIYIYIYMYVCMYVYGLDALFKANILGDHVPPTYEKLLNMWTERGHPVCWL